MRLLSGALTVGIATSAAVLAFTAGSPLLPSDSPGLKLAAEATPPFAVENFAYPQADKIFEEQGIILKRGDGHITLAECGPEGLLRVRMREHSDVCFRITGNEGYLSLELPSVHLIRGTDYETHVSMTVEGEEKTYDINKNNWTSVGEGTDPERREHTLVEIITSA